MGIGFELYGFGQHHIAARVPGVHICAFAEEQCDDRQIILDGHRIEEHRNPGLVEGVGVRPLCQQSGDVSRIAPECLGN